MAAFARRAAGGGPFLRFLPYPMLKRFLHEHETAVGSAVVYVHPWELDPETRTLPDTPRYIRVWKSLGHGRTYRNVERLLADFHFEPIRDVYAAELEASAPRVGPASCDPAP